MPCCNQRACLRSCPQHDALPGWLACCPARCRKAAAARARTAFLTRTCRRFPLLLAAAAGGDDGSGAAGPLGVRHDDKAPSRPLGQPGAKLRGEDWCFELYGTISHEKLHFHLVMTESNEAGSSEPSVNPIKRTLTFVFDPEVDTVDNVAAEISEEFKLSPTDLEICAAALREWMAQNRVPGAEKQ